MWKWTEDENIKAVILDVDSLSDEQITYPFEDDVPNIKVFEVSKQNCKPYGQHIFIEYYDIEDLLYYVLSTFNVKSSELVAISSDSYFLKEMMRNHIGTVLIGKLEKSQLKYTPDYTNGDLSNIFGEQHSGYGAEVITSGMSKIYKKIILKCNSFVGLANGKIENFQLFFGGRYYPRYRGYILDDPLTEVMLDFKKRYNQMVDQYFDSAICLLNKISSIDILTYVPMKPEDFAKGRFDRFQSLQLKQSKEKGIYLQNIIECIKNFSQKQNNTLHRKENVKNAYIVHGDVRGKNIVVIDDLYTTGATISEIAKVLYENGAKNVMGLFFAVNQMIESSNHPYRRIECPICNSDMRLIVSRDSRLFFGCSNYPNCQYTLDSDIGLTKMKKLNRITVEDVLELEEMF